MDWIQQECAAGRKPGRTPMQSAWDRVRTENPTDDLLNGPFDPQKAIDNIGLVWRHYKNYEKALDCCRL